MHYIKNQIIDLSNINNKYKLLNFYFLIFKLN